MVLAADVESGDLQGQGLCPGPTAVEVLHVPGPVTLCAVGSTGLQGHQPCPPGEPDHGQFPFSERDILVSYSYGGSANPTLHPGSSLDCSERQ